MLMSESLARGRSLPLIALRALRLALIPQASANTTGGELECARPTYLLLICPDFRFFFGTFSNSLHVSHSYDRFTLCYLLLS